MKFYLYNELEKEWVNWNSKAHPEDQMSFIDYVEEIDTYKGYKIEIDRGDCGDLVKFVYYGK